MEKLAIIRYRDNVRKLTIKVLEHFPADKLDYRPTPEVRSVAEQFDHILIVETHIRNGLISNTWERSSSFTAEHPDKNLLTDMLRTEHGKTGSMLHMLPSEAFTRLYDTRYGRLTGEALIYLAIDEEVHHRGNLYVYLRLLNIVPPQMVQNYGELFMEDKNG
jgi:uncharacterized damage-inducible protein DinB